MSSVIVRNKILELVDEALRSKVSMCKITPIIGFSSRTIKRWRDNPNSEDKRTTHSNHNPSNKLTKEEREALMSTANSQEFKNLSPHQIVPKLADRGVYMASESTFYRVLRENKQLTHRHKQKQVSRVKPAPLVAKGPNNIYSWDITYLPTTVQGIFFYLYLFMDIYSRKIVGWQIYTQQRSDLASEVMKDIAIKEQVKPNQVTLHSDNGSPMKGATFLTTLQKLGIMPSFSRPSVSDDNPYSESLFKTLKYTPAYPSKPFEDILSARQWCGKFVEWYNNKHCHSGIEFVTPVQRHLLQDKQLLKSRKIVYEKAKANHPNRWSGNTRKWNFINEVHLNPGKVKKEEKKDTLTTNKI